MPYEKTGKETRCIAEDIPFDIPDSWMWVRFGNLVDYAMGKTPPRKDSDYWNHPIYSWVSIADMIADGHIKETKEKVNARAAETVFRGKITPPETLLMSFKLTVGRVSITDIATFHNEAIISIYPFADNERAITKFLFSTLPYLATMGNTKSAIKGNTLNSDSLDALFIPLPPLAEQKRIVAKIEELLPHLDEYDQAETRVEKLNAEFPEQLKKSILQWAIQGKLVPQNPDDEPASVLLDRIRAEKAKLVKAGKIKKDKVESVIFRRDNSHYEKINGVERCIDDEIPFEIPDSWAWCRIGTVFNLQAGKNITSREIQTESSPGLFPCFGGNGIRGYVSQKNRSGSFALIGRQGALCGNINFASGDFYATEHAVVVETFADCSTRWSGLFLQALNLNQYATSTAQPGLAVKNINWVLIPLPPLAEQKRIVEFYFSLFSEVRTLTQFSL